MTQHSHASRVPGCFRCDLSADEVAPRGSWAVVEAWLAHNTSGERWEWVRHPAGYWFNDFGTRAQWSELVDPVELRPGLAP